MKQKLSDRIGDIATWVMMPTVRLTENNPHKVVRVLGVLGMFMLFPFFFIGFPIACVSIFIDIFEDI